MFKEWEAHVLSSCFTRNTLATGNCGNSLRPPKGRNDLFFFFFFLLTLDRECDAEFGNVTRLYIVGLNK